MGNCHQPRTWLVAVPNEAAMSVFSATAIATTAGALVLAAGFRWRRRARDGGTVAHLPSTFRDLLARSVGDPSLEVGFWDASSGVYRDFAGSRVLVPRDDDERVTTRIDQDAAPLAILLHDRSLLDDPAVMRGMAEAARRGAAHLEAYVELWTELGRVADSLHRILHAARDEALSLHAQLDEAVTIPLNQVSSQLAEVGPGNGVDRARVLLARATGEVERIVSGGHPPELALGLARALRTLADESAVPVTIDVPERRYGAAVEAAVYYLCAEATANANKHAQATRIAIRVAPTRTGLRVVVADNGTGGADEKRGSGLRGLSERVAASGGSLHIESLRGNGTRVIAELPSQP